jgi:adenylate cyclase
VKGRTRGIEIYEVIGYADKLTPELKVNLDRYHQALDAYFAQDWPFALSLMQALHEEDPHAKIYKIYIDRILEYMQNPLPTDWDGVYIHMAK